MERSRLIVNFDSSGDKLLSTENVVACGETFDILFRDVTLSGTVRVAFWDYETLLWRSEGSASQGDGGSVLEGLVADTKELADVFRGGSGFFAARLTVGEQVGGDEWRDYGVAYVRLYRGTDPSENPPPARPDVYPTEEELAKWLKEAGVIAGNVTTGATRAEQAAQNASTAAEAAKEAAEEAKAAAEKVGDFSDHIEDHSNPHRVTAAQVGALTETAADGRYLQLAGGTVTGILRMKNPKVAADDDTSHDIAIVPNANGQGLQVQFPGGSTAMIRMKTGALATTAEMKDGDASTLASAKAYADGKVAGAYRYKGTVASKEALPASGNVEGDVWNVSADGMNYAWTGTEWDALGASVDLSAYYTKAEVDGKIEDIELTPGPQGPQGPKGDKGDPGDDATVAIDTTMPSAPADDHVPSTQLLKEQLAGKLSLTGGTLTGTLTVNASVTATSFNIPQGTATHDGGIISIPNGPTMAGAVGIVYKRPQQSTFKPVFLGVSGGDTDSRIQLGDGSVSTTETGLTTVFGLYTPDDRTWARHDLWFTDKLGDTQGTRTWWGLVQDGDELRIVKDKGTPKAYLPLSGGTVSGNVTLNGADNYMRALRFGGSAQEAGLKTRGICGWNVLNQKNGLFLNYDGRDVPTEEYFAAGEGRGVFVCGGLDTQACRVLRKQDGDYFYAAKATTYTKTEVDEKISSALGDIQAALAAI